MIRHGLSNFAATAALLVAGFALAIPTAAHAEEKSLFNGKDLSGWDGRSDLWSVDEGMIVGRTTEENPLKTNTFLVWTEGEPGDFELTFQYRLYGGNSGVQYRSRIVQESEETGPVMAGYQADFEAGTTYNGILYEERGRGILAQRGQKVVVKADADDPQKHQVEVVGSTGDSQELQEAVKQEEWNQYRVVAKGNHLQHYINGKLMVDVVDEHEAKAAEKGKIGFQLHTGPQMTLQLKDIVLKTEE
jgi:hypothetical protein